MLILDPFPVEDMPYLDSRNIDTTFM